MRCEVGGNGVTGARIAATATELKSTNKKFVDGNKKSRRMRRSDEKTYKRRANETKWMSIFLRETGKMKIKIQEEKLQRTQSGCKSGGVEAERGGKRGRAASEYGFLWEKDYYVGA